MPPSIPESSDVPPDIETTAEDDARAAALEADLDARYALFLEELAADVDDPVRGPGAREMLADDPEELRYAWEFAEALMMSSSSTPPPGFIVAGLVQIGFLLMAMAAVLWWLL